MSESEEKGRGGEGRGGEEGLLEGARLGLS